MLASGYVYLLCWNHFKTPFNIISALNQGHPVNVDSKISTKCQRWSNAVQCWWTFQCSFDINCLIRLFILISTNKTKEIGALIISILRVLLIVLEQVIFELIWCTVVYLFSFLFLFVLCTYFRQVMWPRSMVLLSKLMKIFQSLTSFWKFFVFSSNVPLFPIL